MDTNQIKNTNSQILIHAAQKLGIKVDLIDPQKNKLKLTYQNKVHFVTSKSFGINPSKAIKNTHDKEFTNKLLAKYKISTPKEVKINSQADLKSAKLPNFPLVVKPTTGQKGRHVFVGIKDQTSLHQTVSTVLNHYDSALIQKFVAGTDTRFFVLNFKAIGVSLRHPPTITGDGQHTIRELINLHNQKLLKERQKIGRRLQNRILNWPHTKWHLQNQDLSLDTILPNDKTITPYPIANFQAGGIAETTSTNNVNPATISLVETIAKATNLKVCGVDMIINDLTKTPTDNAFFIEINSDPSLRLHHWPNRGKPQPVATKLLKYIFKLQ